MIETIAELIEVLEKYPGHFKVKLDIIEGYDTISNVEEDDKDRPIVYIQN